jgi:hypothetical protein
MSNTTLKKGVKNMKKIIFLVLFASAFAANPVLNFFNRAAAASEIPCQSRTAFEINDLTYADCDCDDCPNCVDDEKKPKKASLEDGIISEATQNQDCLSCFARPLRSIFNVYRNLNDYYIEFFEKNIVKKPVVTKYSKEELEKMAGEYGVDFYKMRVMLVVEAIYEMNGTKKDLNQIKKMSVPELTKIVYNAKNKFFASLTPEEKAKFDAEHRNRKNKTDMKHSSEASV